MHDAAMRAGHFVPDALWTEEFRGARVQALPEAWLEPWVVAAVIGAVAALALAASLSRLRARRQGIRPAGDRLTGLPNGTLLRHRLAAAVAAGERCAVICLRLESYAPVGQALGRRAGERLLVRVGWRLVGAVRPDDLAARLPGAEYAVLVRDGEAAESVAERIRERFAAPVTCDDLLVVLPVGIGVAVARDDEAPSDVLARARRAAEQTQRRPLAAVA
jgi:diguanylate cyclase (GGDEF)-like protein